MGQNEEKRQSRAHIHICNPYEDEYIKVHFIGDHALNRFNELEDHKNPGYEICLIPYGKGFFKILDKTYPISKDQIFITRSFQIHAGWPSRDEPYRILYICFELKEGAGCRNPAWELIREKLEEIDFPVAYDRFDMEKVHCRLMGEVLGRQAFTNELVPSLLQQFVLLTLRNFSVKDDRKGEKSGEYDANLISNRVIHFIDEYIINGKALEGLSLSMVSQSLNYSVSYLCKRFREETGFSVMEYYSFSRLERAKQQLEDTDEPISQISERFGFKSIHHFSNAFKAFYGCSPKGYRNHLKKEETGANLNK